MTNNSCIFVRHKLPFIYGITFNVKCIRLFNQTLTCGVFTDKKLI